jgi:replicative DNA helicase
MKTNPERALIASILLDPLESFDSIDRLGIKPEDLRHSETRLMLKELLKMRDQGDPIDQTALSLSMPSSETAASVWEVTSETAAPAAEYWGKLVLNVSKRSELLIAGEELRKSAENPESDLEQAIDKALLTIDKAQGKGLVTKSETLKQAAAQVIDQLDHPPSYIPTPWAALNETLGGLRPGAFYVVAARPGVGKSLFGLQLAEGISNPERQTAFFSFEMTATELATRALAAKTKTNIGKIDRRALNEAEKKELALAHKELTESLHLIATPSREVTQLRPAIRAININSGGKLKAVVIDYLGLMEAKGSSIYEKVTNISGQLKSLAIELDLPIVALAQLNRKAEERQGVPSLADLRDSGAIEQDADAVLMLANDEFGNLSLTVQKNRQGELASFTGKIDRPTMRLLDLIKDEY